MIQDVAKQSRKDFYFETSKAHLVKRELLSKERASSLKLFDWGVIGHPCEVLKEELIRFLLEAEVPAFSLSGELALQQDILAIAKFRETDREVKEILKQILLFLEYKKRSIELDTIFRESKLQEFKPKQKVKLTFTVSSHGFISSGKFNTTVDSIRCLKNMPFETELVDYNWVIRDAILAWLGIPEKDRGTPGLFLEGLTSEQEIQVWSSIDSKEVPLTGSLKSLLYEKVEGNPWSSFSSLLRINDPFQLQDSFSIYLEKLEGKKVLGANTLGAIIEKESPVREVVFGAYGWDITHQDFLNSERFQQNGLGITGEFIEASEVNFDGVPVEVELSNGLHVLAFDLFDLASQGYSVFSEYSSPIERGMFDLSFGEWSTDKEKPLVGVVSDELLTGIRDFEFHCNPSFKVKKSLDLQKDMKCLRKHL